MVLSQETWNMMERKKEELREIEKKLRSGLENEMRITTNREKELRKRQKKLRKEVEKMEEKFQEIWRGGSGTGIPWWARSSSGQAGLELIENIKRKWGDQ